MNSLTPVQVAWRSPRPLAVALAVASVCACNQVTRHPSSARPDQLLVTLAGDPRTSMAVSWRESAAGTTDRVEVRPHGAASTRTVPATCARLDSRKWARVTNDAI